MADDNAAPQVAPQDMAASAQPAPNFATPPQQATEAPQPSRLGSILAAVAHTTSVGIAGSANQKGRPSFIGGVQGGANAELQDQAKQQDIKFKDFDNQMRAANLHNQDLELQQRTQQQQDAHQKAQDFQSDWDDDHGITHTPHANDGDAVMETLKGQTAATGSSSIPAGTHLSADGKTINMPSDTPETAAGLMSKYNNLKDVLGLPSLPPGASVVPPKYLDVMTHKMGGYDVAGNPLNHDQLKNLIPALQSQRDAAAKNGATPYQLGTLDNLLGIYKANEKNHSDAEDAAFKKNQGQQLDTLDKSEAIKSKYAMEKQDNAASDKPVKAGPDKTELNSVAFDPNYQNPDGTKGGNVVMSKVEAAEKGLQHYKADPGKLNSLVAGFNDVQNKLNMLADVANDPKRMGQVQAGVAAAMLEHGKGISADFHGVGVDTSRINEKLYAEDVKGANQATKDYVTAMVGAHEAVTQLPRLQTFGQSSRMTQQQMEAAQKLLPQPGDAPVARQKMVALQQMLDPLRKQVPHMPGADSTPSWLEKQK